MEIRLYKNEDYSQVVDLYKQTKLYGGQFDENRDSQEKLKLKKDSILIAEEKNKIIGTVSLIEDGRVAWLFRFCVVDNNEEVAKKLFDKAKEIFKSKGHNQVLVYSPLKNKVLDGRYSRLGFKKGNDYTCFWEDI